MNYCKHNVQMSRTFIPFVIDIDSFKLTYIGVSDNLKSASKVYAWQPDDVLIKLE